MSVKLLALALVLTLQTPTVASQATPSPEPDAQAAFSMVISMVKDGVHAQSSRIAALNIAYPQLSPDAIKVMWQLAQSHLCQEKSYLAGVVSDDVALLMNAVATPQEKEAWLAEGYHGCPAPTFSDAVLPYEHPKYRKATAYDEE